MTRFLTIATAAIAVTAIGFTTPASAISLGGAGQTIAQSVDSPILEVGKKRGGGHRKHRRHGKRHGGGWYGGGWHGGYYPKYHGYYPYNGGCYQQVQLNIGGHFIWKTVNVC